MGFIASIKKGWEFMKQAVAMARADRSLLKPSLYQVGISVVYWVIWIGIYIGAGIDPESGSGQLLGVVSLFGSFLIFYFFCGVTVNMIDVHLSGGKPSVKDGIADAKQNFIAICFLAIISTIVELLAKAVRDRGQGGLAIVTSIIAGMIQSLWTMVSFLLLPAIIIEDCSLGVALKRVRSLHKGHFMLVGIGEVGVRLLTGIIGFFVFLALMGLGYFSFGILGGSVGVVVGVLTIGTILSIYVAFSTYLRMAYYTCLYLWAADVEKNGRQAVAPLPLARALG